MKYSPSWPWLVRYKPSQCVNIVIKERWNERIDEYDDVDNRLMNIKLLNCVDEILLADKL